MKLPKVTSGIGACNQPSDHDSGLSAHSNSNQSDSPDGIFVTQRTRLLTEEAFVAALLLPEEAIAAEMEDGDDLPTPKCLEMVIDENPFEACYSDDDDDSILFINEKNTHNNVKEAEDERSDVSSISHDSRKRYITIPSPTAASSPATEAQGRKQPPPKEIQVPSDRTRQILPEWLLDDDGSVLDIDEDLSPEDAEQLRSHAMRTPPLKLNRDMSMPSKSSVASGSMRDFSLADSNATPDDALLGDRTRRPHHRRGHSQATISIGSLVGQSSLITAPTTSSSVSPSTDSVGHHLRTASNAAKLHAQKASSPTPPLTSNSKASNRPPAVPEKLPRTRRRNPMKQEMLHVLGKVATPVKKLAAPVKKFCDIEKKADLRRSTGYLA